MPKPYQDHKEPNDQSKAAPKPKAPTKKSGKVRVNARPSPEYERLSDGSLVRNVPRTVDTKRLERAHKKASKNS